MNAALSALAELEDNPRFMPAVPSAWHDHGDGRTEEVPLVTPEILLRAGTEAIYMVAEMAEVGERFTIETREGLVAAIFAKTKIGAPPEGMQSRPLRMPPAKLTAQQKQQARAIKKWRKSVHQQLRSLAKTGGVRP